MKDDAGRTLVVFTSSMLMFRMTASRWERTSTAPGGSAGMAIRVWRPREGPADPLSEQLTVPVAEFSDVHAVYFEDEVTLVRPGEED